MKPIQSGPNQTNPKWTKSNQTKLEQMKLIQSGPNQTNPKWTKSNQTKPDQIKPDQTRPNETNPKVGGQFSCLYLCLSPPPDKRGVTLGLCNMYLHDQPIIGLKSVNNKYGKTIYSITAQNSKASIHGYPPPTNKKEDKTTTRKTTLIVTPA